MRRFASTMRLVALSAVVTAVLVAPATGGWAVTAATGTAVSHLRTDVVAITTGGPRPGAFFSARVTVLNLGPDTFAGGDLLISVQREVTDFEAIGVRHTGSCTLGKPVAAYDRARCPVKRLGVGDSASLTVRVEVPRALEGKPFVIIAAMLAAKNAPAGAYQGTVRAATTSAAVSWTGTWSTDFGTMLLVQSGSRVTGSYTHDQGRLDGALSSTGRVFTGTWTEAPTRAGPIDAGTFEFQLNPDNR